MRLVMVTLYLLLTVALGTSANVVATRQVDDRLVSHIVFWFAFVAVGLVGMVLAWFGPTYVETLTLGAFVGNALANVAATLIAGPNSRLATLTYVVGEAAVCAVPVLVVSFVVRRGRSRHRRAA